jgi:MscS family membrane protein
MASFVVTAMLLRYGIKIARRTHSRVDDMIFNAAALPSRIVIQALGVYLAFMLLLTGLELPPLVTRWFGRICLAVAAGAAFWYLYHLVDVADYYMRRFAERTDNDFDNTFVDVLRKTLRLFVIAIAVLFIGTYILDWDVTALLASAGIAGLAIAFAAQDTIANLFGTVMLLLDRPFRVGERVLLEGADGPVESIGFRSTRIRTLDGNQVSIPNKTVANSKIENVGRRPHIKRVMTIGVTYDTPYEKVRKAVEILRDILKDHEGMDPEYPPRVYFTEFGAYSLDILAIAWYHPGEYWDYLNWCETVNFRIMKAFENEGIEFAFPTSTNYLAGDPKRPLNLVNPDTNTTGKNTSA